MGNIYRGSQIKKKISGSSVSPPKPSKYDIGNENPGPGIYVSNTETGGPYYSQSQAPMSQTANPGSFLNKSHFNTGVSRSFVLPVAVILDGLKHKTPSPNQHDVRNRRSQKAYTQDGRAAFLSTSERMSFFPHKDAPSPCHYNVNHNLTQVGSTKILSPFKSKTQRIPDLVDNGVPGPGAYSPYEAPAPVKKTILPRGCYLTISSRPAVITTPPPTPGPGYYDGGIYRDTSKRPVPSAAFASKTARIPIQLREGPGPGYYDPLIQSKQSFYFCDTRKWVPA